MLRNRLYAGELVHNRTSKIVEPVSRNVRIRPNATESWAIQPVPELRIIEPALWEQVQLQLEMRATTHPETQRRPKHLLSGLGRCGVCGSGWIKIRRGFWGCSGTRNGAGCSNTRIISDERYQARVLSGLKERLLDPEAVSLCVRLYHEENARRDREEARERHKVERKLADANGRIKRLVEAIAAGAGEFPEVREKLIETRIDQERLLEELASTEAERIIALHPTVASDYRAAVEGLNQTLADYDSPEIREEAIPTIRGLIHSIIVVPAQRGRGVEIEIEGRLNAMIELAMGRPVAETVTLTMERVKGIEPSS